jgi:hypothetical protein
MAQGKKKGARKRRVDILVARGPDYAQYISPCEGAAKAGDRKAVATFLARLDQQNQRWIDAVQSKWGP